MSEYNPLSQLTKKKRRLVNAGNTKKKKLQADNKKKNSTTYISARYEYMCTHENINYDDMVVNPKCLSLFKVKATNPT